MQSIANAGSEFWQTRGALLRPPSPQSDTTALAGPEQLLAFLHARPDYETARNAFTAQLQAFRHKYPMVNIDPLQQALAEDPQVQTIATDLYARLQSSVPAVPETDLEARETLSEIRELLPSSETNLLLLLETKLTQLTASAPQRLAEELSGQAATVDISDFSEPATNTPSETKPRADSEEEKP